MEKETQRAAQAEEDNMALRQELMKQTEVRFGAVWCELMRCGAMRSTAVWSSVVPSHVVWSRVV